MTKKRFKKMVYALYVTNRPSVEKMFAKSKEKVTFGKILKTVREAGFEQNFSTSGGYNESFNILKDLLEGM